GVGIAFVGGVASAVAVAALASAVVVAVVRIGLTLVFVVLLIGFKIKVHGIFTMRALAISIARTVACGIAAAFGVLISAAAVDATVELIVAVVLVLVVVGATVVRLRRLSGGAALHVGVAVGVDAVGTVD